MTDATLQRFAMELADAFDAESLKEMLRSRLNKSLETLLHREEIRTLVSKTELGIICAELVTIAARDGWDADLVREAYRFNPGHPGLLEVYEDYGLAAGVNFTAPAADPAAAPPPGTDVPAAAVPRRAGFEQIVRRDNPNLDIVNLRTRLSDYEVRVCRVDINNAAKGTAFLIGPDLVLTNYHVVKRVLDKDYSESAVTCLFDYKKLGSGKVLEGERVKLHPEGGILAYSPYTQAEADLHPDNSVPEENELDYAVLRLERPFGSEPVVPGVESPMRGWEDLPETSFAFTPDQGIIIAQHPAGEPMKVAEDTKSIIGVNTKGTRVRYQTNTEGGSSGSPVFTMRGDLVALHHYGDPALNHPPEYNQGIAPLHLIRSQIIPQIIKAGLADGLPSVKTYPKPAGNLGVNVTQGIKELELRKGEIAVNQVIRSLEGSLTNLTRTIFKLHGYKELHDCLHNIQVEHGRFGPAARRMPAADAEKDLQEGIDVMLRELKKAKAALLQIPADLVTARRTEQRWIDQLSKGVISKAQMAAPRPTTQEAEQQSTPPQTPPKQRVQLARSARVNLGSLLQKEPYRINQLLLTESELLEVGQLTTLFHQIASLPEAAPSLVESLNTSESSMKTLVDRLPPLLHQHTLWQELDVQLWAAEQAVPKAANTDPDDFAAIWPDILNLVDQLILTEPGSGWAIGLKACAMAVDDTRARDGWFAVAAPFATFRKFAMFSFFDADLSLNTLLRQVANVGASLRDLLR